MSISANQTNTTAVPLMTQRAQLLARLARPVTYDVAVIGGGATGLGVALDAAARGFSTVLLESHDFAKGTSSRATKLVHGGVRYLAQGNIALVREALRERTTLLRNAPHLAQPLAFVMPFYRFWQAPFYGMGLKVYDALAAKASLGSTQLLGRIPTLECLPNVLPLGLKGAVKYWDGQFDDARLALALARTAACKGALVLNYCPVVDLLHEGCKVCGLVCEDAETGHRVAVRARCVINATGVWVDGLRQRDARALGAHTKPLLSPSQGVHIVVDREFLPGKHALMVPRTADGRVLFAVPWLGKLILGTTDSPSQNLAREPQATHEDVAFILSEAARYLKHPPREQDVRSLWVGLRPLVKPPDGDSDTGNTQGISREHTVRISRSGLVTVTGGKWTTYRAMAEDVLRQCMQERLLPECQGGVTAMLPLIGAYNLSSGGPGLDAPQGLHSYGTEAAIVSGLQGAHTELAPGLSEAMVRFAVRHEYARTVEDVLARRTRILFLDARLAASLAPEVAQIIRSELPGHEPQLPSFLRLAQQYLSVPREKST